MPHPPFHRLLTPPERSFFLFGPRGTGKSTWLGRAFPKALRLDLLDTTLALELTRSPGGLEAMIRAGRDRNSPWVILDEIQKIPALLDEVHRLMESGPWKFALCGSSARKLKRSGADLLGGRALQRTMEGFSYAEMGDRFRLGPALEWGTLPLVALSIPDARDLLRSYLNTYIKEEIREEGLVRRIAPFLRFLQVAGMLNGQSLNGSNIASEAQVPRASVDQYFSILEDTLLGHFLPAYQPGLKVRERAHPKFYWFDPGVARAAAGLLDDPLDGFWKGRALETLIFHELRVYNDTQKKYRPIAYYRTGAGVEIDFIIETRKRTAQSPARVVCLEVKSASRWDRSDHGAMTGFLKQTGIKVDKAIGIYLGDRPLRLGPVDVWPLEHFLKRLYAGDVF